MSCYAHNLIVPKKNNFREFNTLCMCLLLSSLWTCPCVQSSVLTEYSLLDKNGGTYLA